MGIDRTAGIMRIGAAALLAGNATVSTLAAIQLRDDQIDLTKWEDYLKQPEFVSGEQLQSDLAGRYLGDDAEAILQLFVDFATASIKVVV